MVTYMYVAFFNTAGGFQDRHPVFLSHSSGGAGPLGAQEEKDAGPSQVEPGDQKGPWYIPSVRLGT